MRIFYFILSAIFSSSLWAQYYKTLPEGVRLGVYRNVQTTDIKSAYNQSSIENPLSFEIEGNIDTLESIAESNKDISDTLNYLKINPDAYESLNLGTYKIDADAQVEVDGFGFAYGITNRVTAYTVVPMYRANINVKFKKTKNNFDQVVDKILEDPSDFTQTVGQSAEPYLKNIDIDAPYIQHVITNELGYKDVGSWEAQGLGDIELGIMHNFYEDENFGLLQTAGVVLPTGYVDDPDTIQDIGFGDGQTDVFYEFGGSYLAKPGLAINSYARYTHQMENDKKMRSPISQDVTIIGDQIAQYREKLGDKFLFHLSSDIALGDWLGLNLAYEIERIDEAKYDAKDSSLNKTESWLASNTSAMTENIRITGMLTSVNAFMKKEFVLPASVKLIYQKMIDGRNTPKMDRFEVEFRMYF